MEYTQIRAGRLRDRGQLLVRDGVSVSGAPNSGNWRVAADGIPASITTSTGRTTEGTGIERERVSTQVLMRHRAGVTNEMLFRQLRGSLEPIDYGIEASYDPDNRNRALILVCVRRGKPVVVSE